MFMISLYVRIVLKWENIVGNVGNFPCFSNEWRCVFNPHRLIQLRIVDESNIKLLGKIGRGGKVTIQRTRSTSTCADIDPVLLSPNLINHFLVFLPSFRLLLYPLIQSFDYLMLKPIRPPTFKCCLHNVVTVYVCHI